MHLGLGSVHLVTAALMVRVHLRLGLENLGCNLDAIKVHLGLEIFLHQVDIFGPFSSTLSDHPL